MRRNQHEWEFVQYGVDFMKKLVIILIMKL